MSFMVTGFCAVKREREGHCTVIKCTSKVSYHKIHSPVPWIDQSGGFSPDPNTKDECALFFCTCYFIQACFKYR